MYKGVITVQERQEPGDVYVKELDIWSQEKHQREATTVVIKRVRKYLLGSEAALLKVRGALKSLSGRDEESKNWFMKSYLRPIVLEGLEAAYWKHQTQFLLGVMSERMVEDRASDHFFETSFESVFIIGFYAAAEDLPLLKATGQLYDSISWPEELSTGLSACMSALEHILDLASADILEDAARLLTTFDADFEPDKRPNKCLIEHYRQVADMIRPGHHPVEWYYNMVRQLAEVLRVPLPAVYHKFRDLLYVKIRQEIPSASAHGKTDTVIGLQMANIGWGFE